jgi:hypothetical protein
MHPWATRAGTGTGTGTGTWRRESRSFSSSRDESGARPSYTSPMCLGSDVNHRPGLAPAPTVGLFAPCPSAYLVSNVPVPVPVPVPDRPLGEPEIGDSP